jgi:cytochrome c-type biogenesis protein CcmH
MDEVLARLESRMASQGGSDSDWELLAQTYEFVGRTADARLARAHQLPAGVAAETAPLPAALPQPAAASAASVSGNVELAGTLKSKVPDGLTLFIVAKSIDSPGPPVAIIRTTTGHWPLAFTLDDSNAMLPGRSLSTTQHVTVEARVSRSGMATPQTGDFQSAVATIDPHDPKSVRIIIDRVIG